MSKTQLNDHEVSSPLIQRRTRLSYVGVMAALLVVVALCGYLIVRPSHATAVCTVDAKLVNSCRPWLGAFANDYPGLSGITQEIAQHENLIGRQVDIVHTYHTFGSLPLSQADQAFILRSNTILLTNWKPSANFGDGGGGNATINANIKTVADNFKAFGIAHPDKKVMLAIWHEPENDVSSGATTCPATIYRGTSGTPAEYRAMWANVRSIFDQEGVNNVVWSMIFQGFKGLDCLKADMWPGNNLVDWVMWDSYLPNNTYTWDTQVGGPYAYFTNNTDATHAYTSKPWGLGEFGAGHDPNGGTSVADQPHTYKFYDDAKAALDSNRYPRLKAYTVFDSRGFHDAKIAYVTITMVFDQLELDHYKAFANDPILTGNAPSSTPSPTPTLPPTPTPTSSPPAGQSADITGPSGTPDGHVNIYDLNFLLANWGAVSGPADITGPNGVPDHHVDIYDLNYLLGHWAG